MGTITYEESVRSLLGNLKNWDWSVAPKYDVHKEDADALIQYLLDDPKMQGVLHNVKRKEE